MRNFLLFMAAIFCCSSIMANPAKEIIFFGDSLTDDGNLLKIMKIIPKSPPYYKGRFTNGPTWAEHVGNYFYNKSYVNSKNYCYGGETTILHSFSSKFTAPMLLDIELNTYFSADPFKNQNQTIFTIWTGANDYLYETTLDMNGVTSAVVNKINDSALRLLNKGAYGVLIMNLPDLSLIPYARNHGVVTRLHEMVSMHNAKLSLAVKMLSEKYPNRVMYYDINATFTDLLSHPDEYNKKYNTHVKDISSSCWSGTVWGLNHTSIKILENELNTSGVDQKNSEMIIASPSLREAYEVSKSFENGHTTCPNADEYFFWDDLHPTAVVHGVLGKIMIDELEKNKWV